MNKSALTSILSSLIVIIAGLLIGFIILLISDAGQAWPAFSTILTFGAGSMRNIGDVLLGATPIILTGLSVAFAFKTGLFNIGAAGQFAWGGFVAILIGIEFTFLPPALRILCMILAAALAGAAWGAIPGILKALFNVHEVISSIMTNYIGMFAVNYLIVSNANIFNQPAARTFALPLDSNLPTFGLDYIFRDPVGDGFRVSQVNAGIIIGILIAVIVYIILDKTTFGYELKACGFNKDAAKYAGINEKKNIVLSMMICGGLAGIGGALNYMNGTVTMSADNVLAAEGFTGISVAFLGLTHPIGVIFSGVFISYLQLGGARMQPFGFSIEIVEVVLSVIIYFCAFVLLMKQSLEKGVFGKAKRKGQTTEDVEDSSDTASDEVLSPLSDFDVGGDK